MTDEQALIPAGQTGELQKYDDAAFDASTAGGSKFLPRVQLMSFKSELCIEGKFPTNHYALIQDSNHQDVGEDVDCIIAAWRPKALEMGEAIIAVHDPEDDEFKRIQERACESGDNGCMYGPEFLIWLPEQEKFATFFMGSKSARRESRAVKARMGMATTFKSKLIKYKGYSWQCPFCVPCTAPMEVPPPEVLAEAVELFNNPPASDVELAEETTDERAR